MTKLYFETEETIKVGCMCVREDAVTEAMKRKVNRTIWDYTAHRDRFRKEEQKELDGLVKEYLSAFDR